jgi:methionyl aminopeptidase
MALIKTEKEIALLREGGKRHAQILAQVAKAVKPGITTAELDGLIYQLITEGGDKPSLLHYTPAGEHIPYPASSCISINEEVVHGIPNQEEKILQVGDIVGIDFGLTHKGMITDATVTVPVGGLEALDEQSRILLHATKEALMAGIKAAIGGSGNIGRNVGGKAGSKPNHIGDIGYAIQQVAKKYHFSLAEGLAGHGVGNKVHEDPYVPNTGRRGGGDILKPGMVLAIEPMLNLGTGRIVLKSDGYTYRTADMKRSAHFEHTVLITDGAAEILTQF